MARGLDRLLRGPKRFLEVQRELFVRRHGHDVLDLLDLPIKIVLSPLTLAFDLAGSAHRGFGVPELLSNLAFSAVFVVGTLGTYDIALEMGKKVLCQRNCKTCNGWRALRCTMCKGTGEVRFQVRNFSLRSGEAATAEHIADAIVDSRAELVHLPTVISNPFPLPSKEFPSCDGTGVTGCSECKDRRLHVRISADDIMEPPWKAYNVLKRMDYPYENIVDSMRDPKIAAFWLLTMPQIMGGFKFDDDVKQKIWWTYEESMKYDQIRGLVAKRKPGWEHFQDVEKPVVSNYGSKSDSEQYTTFLTVGTIGWKFVEGTLRVLISLDPVRAKNDPVIVRNVPYYKAKKALEAEVLKLNAPPRPDNWGAGELNLPLNATSWSEEELKDPKKLLEMTTLLTAQREMEDKILDAQWEAKWRQEKLNELLAEKLQPYMQTEIAVLPKSIVMQSKEKEKKRTRQRRWWFF